MRYNKALKEYNKEHWQAQTAQKIEEVKAEMLERLNEERDSKEKGASSEGGTEKANDTDSTPTPIFIGGNVYIMAPVMGQDAAAFRQMIETSDRIGSALNSPIEIEAEAVEVKEASESPSDR